MAQKQTNTSEKILKLLEDIDNNDENIGTLEEAMRFFCSNYDICAGFKHALRLCIEDQVSNHYDEEIEADMQKLLAILNK